MGRYEPPPPPRPVKEARAFPTTPALLAACLAVLAWIGYRQATAPELPHPPPGWLLKRRPPQVIYVRSPPEPLPAPRQPSPPSPPDRPPAVVEATIEEPNPKMTVQPPAALRPKVDYSQLEKAEADAEKKRKKSLTTSEIMEQCFQLSAGLDTFAAPISIPPTTLALVTAKNICAKALPGEDLFVTAYALTSNGGIAGTEVGHFSGGILPGETQTISVGILCDPDSVRSIAARFRFTTLR